MGQKYKKLALPFEAFELRTLLTEKNTKIEESMDNALKDRQFKVSIERDLAETFKTSCAARGVSMASEISRFMREVSGVPLPSAVVIPDSISTRRNRRNAVAKIAACLRTIADAEDNYKENIPDNLKGGTAYDAAAATVDALEEATSLLEEAFT
jgi:hypothetical protein